MKHPALTWFSKGPAVAFRIFVFVEILNLTVTALLFLLGFNLNDNQSDNARAQRHDQILAIKATKAQCILDSDRAEGQHTYYTSILNRQKNDLLQSQKDLETLKTVPGLNTPQVAAIAQASQERMIKRYQTDVVRTEKLLSTYKISECDKIVIPKE